LRKERVLSKEGIPSSHIYTYIHTQTPCVPTQLAAHKLAEDTGSSARKALCSSHKGPHVPTKRSLSVALLCARTRLTIPAYVHQRWPGARHKAHEFAGFELFQISHQIVQQLLIVLLPMSTGGPRHIALVACDTAALAKDCLVFSPLDETLILPQIGVRS